MTKNTILLIGGGTGGHIFPLIPLSRELEKKNFKTIFVFADQELDHKISEEYFCQNEVAFLKTEKIRRYADGRNFLAPFKIIKSIAQAIQILKDKNAKAVFLKGGFVSFSFLVAVVWSNFFRKKSEKIKIFSHESDISAGVSSVLAQKFSDRHFSNFDGFPLFFVPEKPEKKENTFFPKTKDLKILVLGGSQGAMKINQEIKKIIPELTQKYFLGIICGTNKSFQNKNSKVIVKDFLSPNRSFIGDTRI